MTSRVTFSVLSVTLAFMLGVAVQSRGAAAGQTTAISPTPQASAAPPTPACGPNLSIKNVDKASRCFELRTYTVRDGSSIDLLHARFRDRTTPLFQKHGMTVIGYWQPVAKPNTFVYLLAYKDAAARDASWAAFQVDPDWVKARTDMQVNVQIDNVFMSATDYSPMK